MNHRYPMRRAVARDWLHAALVSAVAFLAVACRSRAFASDGEIAVALTRDSTAVDVHGLDRRVIRSLSVLAPDDPAWTRVLPVFVEPAQSDRLESRDSTAASQRRLPTVLGRYTMTGRRVRFEPRFPFTPGVMYRVEIDTSAAARSEGPSAAVADPHARVTRRFQRAARARARTTRIVAVHPSTPVLPSNTLRWYIETSAPMELGGALEHIRLLDESGREVRGAFLALDQELWDPERRRLTLLFDPGRVKRGVRTNVESGTPIVAGRRYRLVIDAGWRDGTGAELVSGREHAFVGGAADRRSPDPSAWRLTPPQPGTRAPLRVAFGEALDHALAERMLTVLDARGVIVPGWVELVARDSVWMFVPATPWPPGTYTVRVASALEDVAGNNLERPFDVDARVDRAAIDRDVAGSTRTLRFSVTP